jgi:hypothetical protein
MESHENELKSEIASIQAQFASLLDKFKDYENSKKSLGQKMKIDKPFSGYYLEPYEDFEYRRTEYNGTVVWEYLDKAFIQWFVLEDEDRHKMLEDTFQRDCVIKPNNDHHH